MARVWHDSAMRRKAPLLALVSVLVTTTAHAHVAPGTGDNNRYLKLSVLGDRLRLAYTIFYGEVPGAALRKSLDQNRDGQIDDSETQPFGEQIARDVAAAVELTVDGVREPITWSEVVVGMGSPSAAAGAFSIDLVASFCLTARRGKHLLLLRDAYPIDRPGETEVKLEDSPGVTIDSSHIGDADDEHHDYNLVGPSGALERHGLEAGFTIGDLAIATPDDTCGEPPRTRYLPTPVLVVVLLAGLTIAGAGIDHRLRRARAQRKRQ
jgi:hypothetical protein